MPRCVCGSGKKEEHCCLPYHTYQKIPLSPEALMRSRFTAYTCANMTYIQETMRGKPLEGFDAEAVARWSKSVTWLDLKVLNASIDKKKNKGYVDFIARYIEADNLCVIHESSQFNLIDGVWFYTDGELIDTPPIALSRNVSCPCGGGKKYKRCHAKP